MVADGGRRSLDGSSDAFSGRAGLSTTRASSLWPGQAEQILIGTGSCHCSSFVVHKSCSFVVFT